MTLNDVRPIISEQIKELNAIKAIQNDPTWQPTDLIKDKSAYDEFYKRKWGVHPYKARDELREILKQFATLEEQGRSRR